jgi:hypothetical protein
MLQMQNFIEYLEELVDFERSCEIKFRGDNGGIANLHTRLRDIYIDEGQEYIKTADGLRINISQLMEVNGRQVQNNC